MFDLLQHCSLLGEHAGKGLIGFGISHQMGDFRLDKKKDLDLVICRLRTGAEPKKRRRLVTDLAEPYKLALSSEERRRLAALPAVEEAPVGNVLIALEAKAAMTAM